MVPLAWQMKMAHCQPNLVTTHAIGFWMSCGEVERWRRMLIRLVESVLGHTC